MALDVNQPSFSLYKLPLVSIATIIVCYVVLLGILTITGNFSIEESLEGHDLLDLNIMIIVVLLAMMLLVGFMMMVFYYFKMTIFTKHNIIFTIAITILLQFFLWVLSAGCFYLLYHQLLGGWTFLLLFVLKALPLILAGAFFLLVKYGHQYLDLYDGDFPDRAQYWRLTNMLAIFICMNILGGFFSIFWPFLSLLLVKYFGVMSTIALAYLVAYLPVAIYLLILGFRSPLQLQRLNFLKIFKTTVFLFVIAGAVSLVATAIYILITHLIDQGDMGSMGSGLRSLWVLIAFIVGYFPPRKIVNLNLKS